MIEPNTIQTPVLIVGGGPAGLVTAITLARQGIESLTVERRPGANPDPRATNVSTWSMELLRSWGLEDEVQRGAVDVEWVGRASETLASIAQGEFFPVGIPTREQSALVSPTAAACAPQDHLEEVLIEHLRSLPPARVEFGTELTAIETTAAGIEATVRDRAGGEERTVRARYAVAADGLRSGVREALGIAYPGCPNIASRIAVRFRAELWDVVGDHRHGIYAVTHPEATGAFFPAGCGNRWLYGFEPEADGRDYTDERIAERIRTAAGVPDLEPVVEHWAPFTFGVQIAERFREGNAFLIGDAAHRVTPRGGTGMNAAIRDGFDLGWKLAWVLKGWADDPLLDSYETDRRPVVEQLVAWSADENGSIRSPEEGLHADLGGRIPHLWLAADDGTRRSTVDMLGPGLTLFTGNDGADWGEDLDMPIPFETVHLDGVAARALGIRPGGALLVRPDGVPEARLTPPVESRSALALV